MGRKLSKCFSVVQRSAILTEMKFASMNCKPSKWFAFVHSSSSLPVFSLGMQPRYSCMHELSFVANFGLLYSFWLAFTSSLGKPRLLISHACLWWTVVSRNGRDKMIQTFVFFYFLPYVWLVTGLCRVDPTWTWMTQLMGNNRPSQISRQMTCDEILMLS